MRDIFAEKGESYFRRLEKQALEQILSQQSQIIATGGGIILDEDNLTLLRQKSFLIGLTASTDVLVSRVGKNSKRPLLKGVDVRARIEELLQQRQSRYAEADVIIDTSGLTINQVVEKILKVVGSEN